MNKTGLPTLATYLKIFEEIGQTFFDLHGCEIWAQPPWATVTITYSAILIIIFYFYVLIAGLWRARSRLSPIFYRSIFVLAIGDLVILFCSMRESVVQDCVLVDKPARHMAWQTLGTFAVDMIVGSNFVLSFTRVLTVFGYERASRRCSNWLLAVVVIWSTALAIMNHFGLVDIVWFEKGEYHDRFVFPFDYFRVPLLFSEVGLTAFFYTTGAICIRKMFHFYSRKTYRREIKLFVLSLLIFAIEVEFIYATFWFGDYFEVDPEFSANLDYTTRPLATGLTPVIYVVFSSEIRCALSTSFPLKFFVANPTQPEAQSIQTNTIVVKG